MGSELAKSDFDKGAHFLIRWGLPETKSIVVSEFYLQVTTKGHRLYAENGALRP